MYGRVALAAAAAAAGSIVVRGMCPPGMLTADVHGMAAYLGVLGGLYSIVVAFLIYVVWEQYNRVQTGIGQEASALEDLCRVAAFLSERGAWSDIRTAARTYTETVHGDEARRLAQGTTSGPAEERFGALCQAVRGAAVTTEKDDVIYGEMLRALARVNEVRDDRLGVSVTRIPSTLWGLVVFASAALLGGFLVLGLHSTALSAGVAAAVAGTMTFLLLVVRDMDNPFVGAWNVSYRPMEAIAARIGMK